MLAGEIPSRSGEVIRRGSTAPLAGSEECISQGVGVGSAGSLEKVSVDKASYLFLQDCRIRLQPGLKVVSISFPSVGDSFEGKGGILGAVFRKLLIDGFLFTFNYINFVP